MFLGSDDNQPIKVVKQQDSKSLAPIPPVLEENQVEAEDIEQPQSWY